jgi:diguanylate cyclase (GGDEF)-like protein/PAS domain S-box-containing protein
VVEGLGFGVAVASLVHDDRSVEVRMVTGPPEVSELLLGSRSWLDQWDRALARSEDWGLLRFESHTVSDEDDITSWVPDIPVSDKADAWHPLDALWAPLHSVTGRLVGFLSVDLPVDGRIPGALQRELLEMYAVQAGIAIDNAQLTERLRASEESFRLAFENAPVGMSLIDLAPGREGKFLRVNETMCRALGYSRRELETLNFADITHPDHREMDEAAMRRAISGEAPRYETEKRYIRRDGSAMWVAVRSSVIRDSNGTALSAITQFEDIDDRLAEHQELTRQASHDSLTGLPNRSGLPRRIETAIDRARTSGRPGALLFCDLDAFKPINDTYGHAIGDQVLIVVAKRLQAQVRAGDAAVRFGGDEFVVVADDIDEGMLAELLDRLRDSVAAPIDIGGVTYSVTVTAGSVPIRGDETSTEDLIMAADADMYRRKPYARSAVAAGPNVPQQGGTPQLGG